MRVNTALRFVLSHRQNEDMHSVLSYSSLTVNILARANDEVIRIWWIDVGTYLLSEVLLI